MQEENNLSQMGETIDSQIGEAIKILKNNANFRNYKKIETKLVDIIDKFSNLSDRVKELGDKSYKKINHRLLEQNKKELKERNKTVKNLNQQKSELEEKAKSIWTEIEKLPNIDSERDKLRKKEKLIETLEKKNSSYEDDKRLDKQWKEIIGTPGNAYNSVDHEKTKNQLAQAKKEKSKIEKSIKKIESFYVKLTPVYDDIHDLNGEITMEESHLPSLNKNIEYAESAELDNKKLSELMGKISENTSSLQNDISKIKNEFNSSETWEMLNKYIKVITREIIGFCKDFLKLNISKKFTESMAKIDNIKPPEPLDLKTKLKTIIESRPEVTNSESDPTLAKSGRNPGI